MKEITLIPDAPLYNYVDVAVMDYPKGVEDGTLRQRCKVKIEFAKYDVEQLQKRGMNLEQAMDYYKDYLYQVVKVHIASDWTCIEGWDEVMAITRENVARFMQP